MDVAQMTALLRDDAKLRETTEKWSTGWEWTNRNGIGDQINEHKKVTLHDGSTVEMVLDSLATYVAEDLYGSPAGYDPEWGVASGAQAKRVLLRHTDKDGVQTYFKASMVYDSW